MGVLNRVLGLDLTTNDPIIANPFNASSNIMYVVPPPPADYMITESGDFMQTETGLNLMITE